MSLSEIEQSLHEAIDSGDTDTLEYYAEPVSSVWLEAIELIPCTEKAIASIEGAPNVKAE